MNEEPLCERCARNQHTTALTASDTCRCSARICGCYALQVRAGVREDPTYDKLTRRKR